MYGLFLISIFLKPLKIIVISFRPENVARYEKAFLIEYNLHFHRLKPSLDSNVTHYKLQDNAPSFY